MSRSLVGTVCRGRGVASEHLREYAQELERILGAPPIPGTLNLILQGPLGLDVQQCALVRDKRFFWSASVAGIPVLAYRWPGCPLHILEIVAPLMLRAHLGAGDGDSVSIAVEGKQTLTPKQRLSWSILWSLRQDRFYASDYPFLIKRFKRLWRNASQRSTGY